MTDHPSLGNAPDPGVSATACEVGGLLIPSLPPALASLLSSSYPDCSSATPTSDQMRPAVATKSSMVAEAFLPRAKSEGESWLQSLLASWWEGGVEGLLQTSESPICLKLLKLWRLSWSFYPSLYPHLRLTNQQLIQEFSSSHSWQEAPIRCLAWHPHTHKLAVGYNDDTVRVVTSDDSATQPLLKFAGMKGVTCLAWQPLSASQLAVGCSAGVLLWTIDPASVVSRPSSSCVVRLEGLQGPATSVSWSPDGKLVAACSPSDTKLHIWSPASQICEVVHRRGGGGVTLASWSPNKRSLFTATPASVFRVWETKGWTCDRWSVGSGRVAAAAWAPDSLQLVFATTEEPVLYCLSFQAGAEAAVPVMDLSMINLPSSGEAAGGLVQDLQWDPSGRRLAVTFRETSPLLLLRCRPGPLPGRLSPVGWVLGQQPAERPNCIQFQQAGAAMGAMLSIGWSSGRLQQLPLVFGGPDCEGEIWSQQPDPTLNLFSVN